MTCEMPRERLWAWAHDEEDSAVVREATARHVEHCDACRSSVAEMRALVDDLKGLSSGRLQAAPAAMPEVIRDYRILRKLGEGGMGVVYEAEQQQPRRKVALKVIRGDHQIDRFRAVMFRREMQTLARLNHPAIAAIYEAGTSDDGQNFYAMELVEGVELHRHFGGAEQPALTLREKLRLFHRICDAVSHAHQRGVIHRDLKPSNILVDTDGRPKVLDFGLARFTKSDVNAASLVTETNRLIGTLQYMSPEQARGDADAIDVRSDVYALGVILYEMLTGLPPYDVRRTPLHASLRLICESPPISPRALNRSTPRDVVTIVLKALEKEPDRRYQTVADLAADVDRYLTNHPILARRSSRLYRFGKLLQRNKIASGLLTTIVVLAIGSAVGFALQARRISFERDAADREARKSKAINRFLTNTLSSSDPSQSLGEAITVREVFDTAARTVGVELRDEPEVEAAVRSTIGQVYLAISALDRAEEQLTQALAIRRRLSPGDSADVAESLDQLGALWFERADSARAERLMRDSLEMRRRLFGETHPAIAESLHDLGVVVWQRSERKEAERLLREAVAMRRQCLTPGHEETAASLSALGVLLQETGRSDEARAVLEDALRLQRARLGDIHPAIARTLNNLGRVFQDMARLDEAETLYRKALQISRTVFGEEHAAVAANLSNLGNLLYAKGRIDRSRECFERALAIDRKVFGGEHPHVAMGLNDLGAILYASGDLAGAEAKFRESLAVKRKIYGPDHSEIAAGLNNLGVLRRSAGDFDKAETYFREALEINRATHGPEHPTVATNLHNVADALIGKGELRAAERLHREALAMRRRLLGDRHLDVAISLQSLAGLLVAEGDHVQAEPLARECLEIRRALLDENTSAIAEAEGLLGECLAGLGRFEQSEALLRRSWEIFTQLYGEDDQHIRDARRRLADLYRAWQAPKRAAEWRAAPLRTTQPAGRSSEQPAGDQ